MSQLSSKHIPFRSDKWDWVFTYLIPHRTSFSHALARLYTRIYHIAHCARYRRMISWPCMRRNGVRILCLTRANDLSHRSIYAVSSSGGKASNFTEYLTEIFHGRLSGTVICTRSRPYCTGCFRNLHISKSGYLSAYEQEHTLLVMQNKIRLENETRNWILHSGIV